MKTVFSRYQNIAAGKFTAAQSDIDSENYNEEEWSGLNDVETALKALGIKIRSSVDTFRDFDDVMEEIASKWDTYSSVQQSGIATSLAGVRQRENVITLFENWDLVKKYEDISANAYGTAVEKMEAYSQGVEAARKRVQAAWEGFALIVNESGALEAAFNGLATAIENIHWIILAAITSLVASNPAGAAATLSQAFTKLSLTLGSTGLEQKLGLVGDSQATIEAAKQARIDMADAAFVRQKQILWGDYLGKFKGGMNDERFSGFSEYQSELIGLDKTDESEHFIAGLSGFAAALQKGKDGAELATKSLDFLRENIDEGKAQILLNTVSKETANTLVLSQKKHIEEGLTEEQLADQTTILAEARKRAAMQLLDDMGAEKSQYYSESDRKVFTTATGNAQRARSQSRQKLAVSAMGSLFGSIAGGYGGSKGLGGIFASTMGEDARSAGESIGSIIGMVAGQKAVTSLIAVLGKGLTGKALVGALAGPVGVGFALIAGAGYGIYRLFKKKAIQKAQEDFKELKDTYESQLSASTKTSRYDELSKGVDQFGRNVSLTEEEYSEFLSTSNELAEIFPELVVRTDEAGNSFLGTAGKVGKLTEAVDDMVKASQKAADIQLLSDNIFGEAFDEAKASYKKNSSGMQQLQEQVTKGGYWSNTFKLGQAGPSQTFTAYSKKELEEKKSEIKSMEEASRKALSSLTDYNNAIMREDFGLQATLSSMSEDSAILVKQTMQKVFSSLDLTQYANEDEYRADIEKISNQIADAYKENPILATLDVEMGSSATSGEYYEARQKVLENIIQAFGGYADLDDDEKKILIKLGFEMDEDGNWFDTTDIRKKIEDEGLGAKLMGVNLDAFSKEDLERAYEILKGATFLGATFNTEQLQQAIFADKYSDAGLSKLASLYKSYTEEDSLTPIEQKNKEFIEGKLDGWAKELGVVKGDYKDISAYYDEIIRKAKIYGNIDSAGMSQETPEEVKERMDKYAKYYKFIRDEYSKTGKWDLDTYNEMIKDKDLQGYLANNDVSGLTKFLKETLEDAPNIYKNAYQAILWENEDINKEMQEKHKEVYEQFEKDYGFDLTNFTTLTAAKEAIDLYTNSLMTSNYEQWKNALASIYQEDLAQFTSAAMQKAAINNLIMNSLGMTDSDKRIFLNQTSAEWKNAGGKEGTGLTLSDYRNQALFKKNQEIKTAAFKDGLQGYANAIGEAMQTVANLIPRGDVNYDILDDGTSQLGKEIERIEALIGMYQKEYYLRKSLIEQGNLTAEGQDSFMSPEYYDRMRNAYQMQADYYKQRIPWNKDISQWSAEQMGYYQKYQQAMINLNNLDDEQVEDKINILQLQDVSYDQLIAAQEELIKTSDTLEEQITRENELNNLIKQRYELYRDIASWQREMLDIALEYESGTPDTAGYADLVSQKKQNLENEMEAVKQRMAEIQDSDRKDKQEELRNLAKQYAELYKEYATVDIDVLNDKLDVLERRLDLLEKSKPQEWAKYDDIAPYYQQNIGYLEQKAALIREQLEDVSMLTDEQVQNLVDQLNDVTVALHEAQMQMLEDQKNYKESQYNALVSKVQEYITELEDAMDEIEKAYEDELKPLEQANEERERAIKLEELLAAKKRAAQEKERVYRQGIGWVYESPRSKQREAQKDLDDFKRQDKIDDLTGTKDAEKEALQERIDNLNLYLKALEWSWNEAERIERDRLLAEMMNIDQSLSNEEIQKEMRQRIMDDMQNFIEVQNNDYQNYLGIFSSFINSYTQLVLQLAELQRQALSLINSSQYLGSNAGGSFSITNATGGGGFGNALDRFDSGVDYSRDFQAEINAALKDPRNYGPDGQLSAEGKAHLAKLEKYRNEKIDLALGGNYEKTYNYTSGSSSGGGSGKSSGGSGNKTSSSSPYNSKTDYNNESKYLDNLIKNGSAGQKAWAQNQKKELDKAQKGYANGIENGPVTYTGLSMLHGTHSKPEYVLNSDQAYNILRNLATTKLPEYTSTLSQDMGVSYVIQGDVVLENCDDPAQFWNQVMAATHNRYNVTKNKR